MTPKDYCKTAPFSKPKDCEDVAHNWNKLSDLHEAFCCLLSQEVITQRLCFTTTVEGEDRIPLPVEWKPFLTANECDYDIEWNGQDRYYSGSALGEYEWTIDLVTCEIVFNQPIGDVGDPCVFAAKFLVKQALIDILDCITSNC